MEKETYYLGNVFVLQDPPKRVERIKGVESLKDNEIREKCLKNALFARAYKSLRRV